MPAPLSAVTAALQMGPGPGPQVEPVANPLLNLAGSAVGAFLTTLVVGAILVAVAPDYTERKMAALLEAPVGSFLYGFAAAVFLLLVIVVLVFTIIGILVAIPLALVLYVIWAVGAAIAFLAVGERLVGRDDGWAKPLVVGAAINGALTLTGIGGLLTFAIGAAGFGAVLRDYLG
ncbi:hypothetical protein [Haloarcula onubensis]|uniref:DUF8173 domain-containing protein n=1 Tax=Haloarcula onubensis TaxID=2950539 RepID=A0ABU2FQ94_9EURY|nr:hypothetical protein [Halomicroarcula sp. S3CR25-11]MDS0282925.1 hypothetical protein [Halomicroarcula sp. S3CR25-11]